MLIRGPAGSGRSAALLARLASLAEDGVGPERVLLVCRTRAAGSVMRDRAEETLAHAHEALWIGTYEEIAERLLREYSVEAGLDPFFTTVTPADRLAIMLDRVDELPLRRHEIRGNPAGLLARLLRRIDVLKAEAVTPGKLRDWAADRDGAASGVADRERARRELEFAELYARHDSILREAGSLDGGDLVSELTQLVADRADVAGTLGERFGQLMIDELEDASRSHVRLLDALGTALGGNVVATFDGDQCVRRFRGSPDGALAWFERAYPEAEQLELDAPLRFGGSLATAASALCSVEEKSSVPSAVAEDEPESEPSHVRFWRCRSERAQAQAVAREIEHLLAAGEVIPGDICVVVASDWREGRLVAGALEERSVPYRSAGDDAFFQRSEVRDTLAWLRMLADPGDAAAVVRALTRPPVDLRSTDLARVTTIARRRKLDMVSALEAALESPQLPPEARDRISSFLKLHKAAAAAMEEMRADVFVRRLIERVGLRRHRLFAATPETAERLVNLSRLAEIAADWCRREPRGTVRDFTRHLTAVADAGEVGREDADPPEPGAVMLAEPQQVKGLEFEHVYLVGLQSDAIRLAPWEDRWVPEELAGGELPEAGDELLAARRLRLGYVAMTRARTGLVASYSEQSEGRPANPSPIYERTLAVLDASEEIHDEEVFGPAEGLHATYRMIRDEVLEASWRAGSALSEMRLDTVEDLNKAVARYLELIKLAALIQQPGAEGPKEAIAAINDLLARIASPEQGAALEASSLDDYVMGEESDRAERRKSVAARREPSLEQFIPRRGDGLKLSASDLDLYRTCPLKYKFARVFAIPQEPTINMRFGIVIHQVLDRFHKEELHGGNGKMLPPGPGGRVSGKIGTLDRLLSLFEGGWKRSGFGASDDELQYRDRAVAALARYHERHINETSKPMWLERSFAFSIGPHQLRGRVDRVDQMQDGGYEVIDYKTGGQKDHEEIAGDVQLALYRLAARESWELEVDQGAYWYVLDDQRVEIPAQPDDAERVERTVLEVAAGVEAQDFEPRPSYRICSWCDYRLICPASEA
jgi:DNA helicase-2/ATP-dependent DNA helicase PcrA